MGGIMQAITKLKNDIKVLKETDSSGLLILGSGGLGKTKTVLEELKNREYLYLNGTVTPLQLYKELYFNQEKLIVLDDVEGLFDNNRAIGLLKGALWDANGKRIVTYDSTSHALMDVPNQFEFKGKVIIITNQLPIKNKHIQALKTRMFFTEVTYSYAEKKELVQKICLKSPEFQDFTTKQRREVWKALDKAITPAVEDFNFRHVKQAYQYYATFKKGAWRTMLYGLFPVDELKAKAIEIMNNKRLRTVKQQVAVWKSETGMCRASYFNYKRKLK
jgi:hypothetical protein